jgi:hypothetical protein
MDVLDISERYDHLELERVNLEAYYADLQERLRHAGRDPDETKDLLRQAVNALNVERELSRELFALLADVMLGWVEAKHDAAGDRPS